MVEVIMTKPTSTKTSTTTKTTTTTKVPPPWAADTNTLSKKSTVTTAKGNNYLSSFSASNITRLCIIFHSLTWPIISPAACGFQCSNSSTTKCIPAYEKCDGYYNCGDGSDEENCGMYFWGLVKKHFYVFQLTLRNISHLD